MAPWILAVKRKVSTLTDPFTLSMLTLLKSGSAKFSRLSSFFIALLIENQYVY
ncbi:hypothetical protein [Shewanella sp. UCD-KL12]|uniref:hypothetical protein n=1 Tax=Shewanella sp. UCD-KL12 TaxID=1917163 RepID=UPI0015C3F69F|nr:hypothetical protein [Shewanella sp. UCD-KL12]